MNERYCLECHQRIEGRKDKKFCSYYCKSSYHYKKNKEKEETLFEKIDTQLKKNRKILRQYNKSGKSIVRKQVILDEGFNPRFFTHYYKTQNGNLYLFCYEFGFMETKENDKLKYVLVTWQKYMEKD